MKTIKFILVTFLVLACQCCQNKKVTNLNVSDEQKISSQQNDDSLAYCEIVNYYEKGYYNALETCALSEFKVTFKQSIYLDSVLIIEKKIINNRKKLNQQRDSLLHVSLSAYFDNLNMSKLDSINKKNFEPLSHYYRCDFTDTDEKIIPKPNKYVDRNWYLSKRHC